MWTVAQLAHDLAAGRTTSRELVEQALMRIAAAYGEGPRAFLKVYEDAARTDADHADALRKRGVRRSAVDGLPVSLKDLFDVAGDVTRAGSKVLALVAKQDAGAVARLRAAGAIFVGRTNMVEFAFGGVGVIRIGARRVLVNLEEGARAFAIGGSDTHERLLDELAARGAPGGKVVRELGYSPH